MGGHRPEDSQQILERRPAARMIQGLIPRRMMTEIRDFQDGQDGSVLTDATVVNLAGRPLADRFTALPARGDSRARSGKSVCGLRP